MSRIWTLNSPAEMDEFKKYIAELRLAGIVPKVKFVEKQRSTAQNSMIYALYGQIAEQSDDLTVDDVRAHCKLYYGVPLLRAYDPDFRELWDLKFLGHKATVEDKLTLMTYMDITSLFTPEQASEYIAVIIEKYTQQGYFLANEQEAEKKEM